MIISIAHATPLNQLSFLVKLIDIKQFKTGNETDGRERVFYRGGNLAVIMSYYRYTEIFTVIWNPVRGLKTNGF